MNKIIFGDNLPILREMPSESIDLIYIDPPFNTGKVQKHTRLKTYRDQNGNRKGFKGQTYQSIELSTKAYQDSFDFYIDQEAINPNIEIAYLNLAPESSLYFLEVFLRPRIEEAYRLLKSHGCLYFHIDYRESHYCKILLDRIFKRENFINEIIWAYDFGGRSKTKWPAKHDTIFFYAKDSKKFIFNTSEIDREDYMAPGLVGPEKAKKKKLPTDTWWYTYVGMTGDSPWDYDPNEGLKLTDTWWHTIVGTNSKERMGYPTQKPKKIIDRIIKASSPLGGVVLDFFAGSGTVGASCLDLSREFILIDNNPAALEVMAQRFSNIDNIEWFNFDPKPYQQMKDSEKPYKPKDSSIKLHSEFIQLASFAGAFQKIEDKNKDQSDIWKNSPFEWILQLPAAKKGKLARFLITSWCNSKGIRVKPAKGAKNLALDINDSLAVVKMSTRWIDGKYQFQQVRDSGYDYVICLGISPFEAHCWVFKLDYAIKHATLQHKGLKGGEYWIGIDPISPESWTVGRGGKLEDAYKILKDI